MNSTLQILSWNLRGMGDAFRGKALRRWINKFHKDLNIICLQELKAKQEKIEFQCKTLFPDKRFIVDYTVEGRAGTTVGILSNCNIQDSGTKGDGSFAWCTIDTVVGPVSVGSVYAPNERARRKEL